MVKERLEMSASFSQDECVLEVWDKATNEWWDRVGLVSVEIVEGNVVITVERKDEEKFGPVSLVVV